jgi:hypothetical protein
VAAPGWSRRGSFAPVNVRRTSCASSNKTHDPFLSIRPDWLDHEVPTTTSPEALTVIDLRDGSADVAAAAKELRIHGWWRKGGVILLAILNALDLITTRMFMDKGVEEGNPIAAQLLEANMAGPVKFGMLAALAYLVWTKPPRIATTCVIWMVCGIYAAVVAVNTWIVVSI